MKSVASLKVLVTCGATWSPIDEVRVISNVSSGQMGHLIAEAFERQGAKVTVVEGPVTHPWNPKGIRIIKYRFFDELADILKRELLHPYDVVVHAAAVADFKVKGKLKGKISSRKPLTLNLVATPKLIESFKRLNPGAFLIGFKLLTDLKQEHVLKEVKPLFKRSACDLVVANSLKGGYQGLILAEGKILAKTDRKEKIAHALVKLYDEISHPRS